MRVADQSAAFLQIAHGTEIVSVPLLNARAGGGCPGNADAYAPLSRAGASARAACRSSNRSRGRADDALREHAGDYAPSVHAHARARGAP